MCERIALIFGPLSMTTVVAAASVSAVGSSTAGDMDAVGFVARRDHVVE